MKKTKINSFRLFLQQKRNICYKKAMLLLLSALLLFLSACAVEKTGVSITEAGATNGTTVAPSITTSSSVETSDPGFDWSIPAEFTAAAYSQPTQDIAPLDDDLRRELEYVWYIQKGYRFQWLDMDRIVTRHYGMRFLGLYGGYAVLFYPENQMGHSTTIIVGTELLTHTSSFTVYLYRDHVFYTVQEAYEQGLVTLENVEKINQVHQDLEAAVQAHPNLDDPNSVSADFPTVLPLEEEAKKEIEVAWKTQFFKDPNQTLQWYDGSLSHSGVAYYGIYEGSMVFFQPSWAPMSETKNIAGVNFSYYYLFNLYLYEEGGTFVKLEEAFNLGLISEEAIKQIALYHKAHVE